MDQTNRAPSFAEGFCWSFAEESHTLELRGYYSPPA